MERGPRLVLGGLGVLLLIGVIVVFGAPFLFAQWAPIMIEDAQADTQDKTVQETSGITDCSSIVIRITSGSAESALISQVAGEKPAGKVAVTWFYQNSPPVQKDMMIESSRGRSRVSSGSSGTLDQIEATPVDCEGAATATYSP